MERLLPSLIGVAVLLLIASSSLFTVDQRQFAMVFQFGEVVRVIEQPGIQFKVPVLQNVRYYDRRIQTIDPEEPELFNTREKKNVLVDSFVKWRVRDVEQFYKSVGGNELAAVARLKQTINDGLRAEFGQKSVADVVSGQRDQVMEDVRKKANLDAQKIGMEILDVRLKRVDFPDKISASVFERMNSERRTVASQLRSEGAAEAERIRADADRQREVLLAEAYRKAQTMKGEGDARAGAIYAQAYGKNPEFYAFWRSMDAYKQTMRNKSDVLVLDPSSEFFKYFKSTKPAAK
ncbi:membrane protein [Vogesella sp. EB]|uniref:Protein HflC n=1 Tax=Vogesella indigofera TaxID=45465 RepID=A0A495B175_VOGIN|nr:MULTISPECIES: protease modulator HflC [Vogesella]KMJ54037.1 membrane protein [Vogesella sp. EB]MDC7699354.1 protease modulator HflC [Vogesella indigofera]MDC7702440.1 protease modulator HflC [Vogesella indigofera]MDC7708913.1 protease modulator HflC [Vogesella indigofera]RKQ54722.1 protease FtsH subunit HflC [Vogesella indigofera]